MKPSDPLRDFRQRKTFPGTVGGPFEILVTSGNLVENLPHFIFLPLLFLLAVAPNLSSWSRALGLFAFYLVDWALIALLPRLEISYGPSKPQALLLAILRLPFAFLPDLWFWGVQILGTGLVVYGFWVEPQWLSVDRQSLKSEKLVRGRALRILHFGDLHMERMRRIDHHLIREVRDLEPDMILFSGDALSYSSVDDPIAWEAANRVFSRLDAPLGVYAVPGSPPVDTDQALEHVYSDTSVCLLMDESISVSLGEREIELVGVTCSHKPFVDAPKVEKLTQEPTENLRILLYHSPDIAPAAARKAVDLQLSGHTHGGQVRLPFFGALYTSSLHGKKFEVGRLTIGGMILYVTRGIGMEGMSAPRVRFLCRPQITVWELSSPE